MMCPRCESPNPDGKRFCGDCGAPLANECPQCNTDNPPGKKFCGDCGASLTVSGNRDPSPPSPPIAQHPAPPTQLADRIRQSRASLEGERKHVTVLFADVQGSMDIAGQLDPEVWSGIMQRFFAILTEGVARFEGFVDKFTGDGIMALFGAPIAHEDHAHRAGFAALYLRDTLDRYATEVKRMHGVGFSTRMGINSGEVVVGTIGDDLRMSYTAVGHTVGLAQRMEALASPDTCYLTAATAALVRGYFRLEDLGDFRVKGAAEPVRVHRLLGPGAATTRLDVSRARGLSRFVGRDADMATLEAALAQAQAGNGQVVGIVAAAGTGKSRLCFEFAERCRARGIAVNEGHAVAHGKSIPYLPMLEVCRAYFGIDERDDEATARDKIAGRLLLLDDGFREVLPVLFEFFQVPDRAHPVPRMDPDVKQRHIFAAVRRVVQDRRAGAERVFSIIEDLHWLDPASEGMLAQWVDAIAGSSSLLVVNFRPEYRAGWMQKSYYRQIPLTPLGSDAIRELLAGLLGTHESTAGLAETIHARTGGNPFFIEEVVQGLIESGHLAGAQGAYRLVRPVDQLDVPPSVQALLAARIDRLGEHEKQVLQTAAVIGKEFAEPILRQVLAATSSRALTVDGALAGAIETLKAREFLYETSLFPVTIYAFKHPLTQEVALGSQLQERRRAIHAAVADAIEAAHADKLDEQAALLGHHRAEAGEMFAAAQWHARAAAFLARSDLNESGRHWQRVRELVRSVAEDARAPEVGAHACFRALGLSFRLGIPDAEAQDIFRQGLEWATRTTDPLIAARLYQAMSVFETGNNRVDEGLRHAREWMLAVRTSSDAERRACALWPTLVPLLIRGDLATLRANCEQQIAWTQGHPEWGVRDWDVSALQDALQNLALVEVREGTLDAAQALVARSLAAVRGLHPGYEAYSANCLGQISFLAGDPDLARVGLERSVRLAEPLGALARQLAYGNLGRQLLADGRVGDAIEALEYAQSLSKDGNRTQELWLALALASARLAAGEVARALTEAEAVLRMCLGIDARLLGIDAALVVSACLRTARDADAAASITEVLATAERLIAETGARNMTALVLVERADLAALRGDTQQEAACLRSAHAEFVRMAARGRARDAQLRLERMGA